MAIRSILSVVGADQGDGDVKRVAALCEETGAHLSVLVVSLAAPPPIGEYAAMVSDAWMEERQAALDALKARAATITDNLAGSPVSCDVSVEYPESAWAEEVIGRRGRYADLTVLGPELMAGDTLKAKAFEGALFTSGKPVLLLPEGAATLKPRTVLVGWDSRIEATRAAREALDILAQAKDVRLTLVDPEEDDHGHGAEPGADAAAYLARHGVKVAVDRLPGMGMSAAETLRRHAIDTGAEMIVMGGYGHSRLRQRIFGGVTRSMLEQPPVPVFLAR